MYCKIAFFVVLCIHACALSISREDAQKIGDKIWDNECGRKASLLTHWNKGENFPSLGIGHFIWFPTQHKEPFEETFPALLAFLQSNKVILPSWLTVDSSCPWDTRDAFYADIDSPKMNGLRKLLLDTRPLQAIFMAHRLENTRSLLIEACPDKEQVAISVLFERLIQNPSGLYALLDYLNFKGSGLSAQERYKGQGWGLLQVLQDMPKNSQQPLIDFVASAKKVLHQRVQNAPPERHEEKWEKGWMKRLHTYYEETQ